MVITACSSESCVPFADRMESSVPEIWEKITIGVVEIFFPMLPGRNRRRLRIVGQRYSGARQTLLNLECERNFGGQVFRYASFAAAITTPRVRGSTPDFAVVVLKRCNLGFEVKDCMPGKSYDAVWKHSWV
ncbi:hypothetical protein HDU84_005295 [Entophlyctis sp. JEL0112]|nr:hypothetical protein HDU84_005295 [Entophlyctis sp. JEL0112]